MKKIERIRMRMAINTAQLLTANYIGNIDQWKLLHKWFYAIYRNLSSCYDAIQILVFLKFSQMADI